MTAAGAGIAALAYLYGIGRVIVALLMAGAIILLSVRKLTKVTSIPPDPELTDVGSYDLRYICSVCGLELKVEVAARDKPPTHCGEAMTLTSGSRTPLRPV